MNTTTAAQSDGDDRDDRDEENRPPGEELVSGEKRAPRNKHVSVTPVLRVDWDEDGDPAAILLDPDGRPSTSGNAVED